MIAVLILCIIICFAVIWITVITTNKAYAYKHSVDPVENHDQSKEKGEHMSKY